jgi:hypothetical protein
MVRITRKPRGRVNGIELNHFREGATYELDASLAEYLVVQGYADIEMRRGERSRRTRANERRRRRFEPYY